jgi:hypothetical protein
MNVGYGMKKVLSVGNSNLKTHRAMKKIWGPLPTEPECISDNPCNITLGYRSENL